MLRLLLTPLNSSASNFQATVHRTQSPAVQFPWLPALTLLGIPSAIIFVWLFEHMLFATISFGWGAFAELVLPLGACIFSAVVFLVPNPMHALLALLGVFFTTVLLYLAAGIAFVGLVFLIVYVGAVAVLFLFVIMLLNVKSLTSKDRLVRHATQWAAIVAAIVLFQQLHITIVNTLYRALLSNQGRDAAVECTTSEAVAYYVRYQAADINGLVSLYTTHATTFLVLTILLLAALLGAIILATVTTERATAVSDISQYRSTGPATCGSALFGFGLFAEQEPMSFGFLTAIIDFYAWPAPVIIFMSYYIITSRRNHYIINDRDDLAYVARYKKEQPKKYKRLFVDSRLHLVQDKLAGKIRAVITEKKRRTWEIRSHDTTRVYWFKAPIVRLVKKLPRVRFVASRLPAQRRNRKRIKASPARRLAVTYRALAKMRRLVSSALCDKRRLLAVKETFVTRRLRWLWHWRPERAASLWRLTRARRSLVNEGMVTSKTRLWHWKPKERPEPLTRSSLGLRKYVRFIWTTKVLPSLCYWAWRAHAFTAVFFAMVVLIPAVLVPVPWFLDDYDIVWTAFKTIHDDAYNFLDKSTPLAPTAHWFKEVITFILLYPLAMVRIALRNPYYLSALAAAFAYDAVLFTGGDFAHAALQESSSSYLRIVPEKRIARALEPTEAELARRRRHPDKGRTDFGSSALLALSGAGGVSSPLILLNTTLTLPDGAENPGACPVAIGWTDFYALLRPICRVLSEAVYHTTPYWINRLLLSANAGLTQLLPIFTVVGLIYAISGITLWASWRRLYGAGPRISLFRHIFVFCVIVHFWLMFYPFLNVAAIPYFRTVNMLMGTQHFLLDLHWRAIIKLVALIVYPLFVISAPYFLYRRWFTKYAVFDEGRLFMGRRFMNYYVRHLGSFLPRDTEALDKVLALPDEEVRSLITTKEEKLAAVEKAKKRKRRRLATYVVRFKRLKRKDHDPDPDPNSVRKLRSFPLPYKKHPLTTWGTDH